MRYSGVLAITLILWIATVAAFATAPGGVQPQLAQAAPPGTPPPTGTAGTPAETPVTPSPTATPTQSPVTPSPTATPVSPSPTATPTQSPEELKKLRELMERVVGRLEGVKQLQCPVELQVMMQMGAIMLPMDLGGVYTYTHPDVHVMKLTRVPKILSRYPNVFAWNDRDLLNYRCSFLPDATVRGVPCRVVRMDAVDPKNDIRQRVIWVSTIDYTTPRQVFRYPDGDIMADVKYRAQSRYLVFDKISANLSFPAFSLTAQVDAECGEYTVIEEPCPPPAGGAKSGP